MNIDINIRNEEQRDHRIVEELTREAFWNHYAPGCCEHLLLHQLRECPDFIPELDFVAVRGAQIVGNIVYTRSKVVSRNGTELPTITFGPVAVIPECQKRGYGAALVEHSMGIARKMKFGAILIYGDPAYYGRFGFTGSSRFGICRVDGKFPKALLAVELRNGYFDGCNGYFGESPFFQFDETELAEFDGGFPPKEKFVTERQKCHEILANALEETSSQ